MSGSADWRKREKGIFIFISVFYTPAVSERGSLTGQVIRVIPGWDGGGKAVSVGFGIPGQPLWLPGSD